MPQSQTVFLHAVGFTGATLAPVAARVPGRTVCLDVAGHGEAHLPPADGYSWRAAGERLLADLERVGSPEGPRIGFGHSGGGTALLWAEVLAPGTFSALFLYEPPVRGVVAEQWPSGVPPLAESVRRRRDFFESRAAFEQYLRERRPYLQFSDEALAAYVETGLRALDDGGFALACPPAIESSMYATPDEGLAARLGEVRAELVIAQGAETFERFEVLCTALAESLPGSRRVVVPGLTHFGPLESPETVAEVFRRETLDTLADAALCADR